MDVAAKIIDPMVPDLANPPRIRKRRAPKHDFKDGQGRVFAHKHDNGGGWVADTAHVAPGVKVTRNAQVFGFARVHDECEITGRAKVYGRARLFDRVKLSQDAVVRDNAMISDTAHLVDNVFVHGHARVLGNTRLSNRLEIFDHAVVINCQMSGPRANVMARVHGNARLLNCHAWHWFDIYDAVIAENTQFSNATANFSARLLNSQVTTNMPYQYTMFLDGRHSTLDTGLPGIALATTVIWGTLINSQFYTPRTVVQANTKYVDTVIAYANNNMDDTFMEDAFRDVDRHTFVGWNARDPNAIRNMVNTVLNPRAAAVANALPPPARGEANFDAVRQRRIMRMEGA